MTKLIQILCALLLCIAIASATVSSKDCSITQQNIGSWKQGNQMITQWAVTIHNNSNKQIKQVHISTDQSLKLRDKSSIWNIAKQSNGDLTLPTGQTIAAHGTHTFYCILKGTTRANLYIKSITN